MSVRSDAEEALHRALMDDPLVGWDLVREHRFHPERRWRFDFAFPSQKLGIEVNGRGAHQSVLGVRRDYEKWNTAVCMGWSVLLFPATDKARASEWAGLIRECLLTRRAA